MERYIILADLDRPDEAFEVEVIAGDERVLKVAVPNTVVQFSLFRRERDARYEGSLGGRSFGFVPAVAKAKNDATQETRTKNYLTAGITRPIK